MSDKLKDFYTNAPGREPEPGDKFLIVIDKDAHPYGYGLREIKAVFTQEMVSALPTIHKNKNVRTLLRTPNGDRWVYDGVCAVCNRQAWTRCTC